MEIILWAKAKSFFAANDLRIDKRLLMTTNNRQTSINGNVQSEWLWRSITPEIITKVCKVILAYCKWTICLFDCLPIFCLMIWTWDAFFMLKVLSNEKKMHYVSTWTEFKQQVRYNPNNFITNILTSDNHGFMVIILQAVTTAEVSISTVAK